MRLSVQAGKLLVVVLLIGIARSAVAVEINCSRPEPPVLPDPSRAVEQDLATAGPAVREYATLAQEFLACLDAREASYGDTLTEEQRALITAIYNAAVDELNGVVGRYNESVRAVQGG